MSLRFCVLGSGSRGNSTIVRLGEEPRERGALLIDAGLSPRDTVRRMHAVGVAADELGGILLTHLDADHFRPTWARPCIEREIPLYAHRRHAFYLQQHRELRPMIRIFDDAALELDDGTRIGTMLLAHDDEGVVGYRIERQQRALGFATDLGRVPKQLPGFLSGVDVLAIESNYDPHLQRLSSRPAFLKQRIMGGRGHLSNEQSLDLVLRLAANGRAPSRIALLHLSRECNNPDLIRDLYAARAEHLLERLVITHQDHPSPWIDVHSREHAATAPATVVQSNLF